MVKLSFAAKYKFQGLVQTDGRIDEKEANIKNSLIKPKYSSWNRYLTESQSESKHH